jgi:hypothetical protein
LKEEIMPIARSALAVVFFASGLAIGAWWCPRGGSSRAPGSLAASEAKSKYESDVAQMPAMDAESAEFCAQFKDLTSRLTKDPLDARFSPDGRFVIRVRGEAIASELRYPMHCPPLASRTDLVRCYSFTCGDKTYSCDFSRSIEDPIRITNVQFHVVYAKGGELSYVDSNGDGRWNKFIDYTEKTPKFYVRDGLSWRKVVKE